MFCPCGSLKKYEDCCQPIIELVKAPSTAEALMRSRYSAYSLKNYQYIYNTYAKKTRELQHIDEIKSWADDTTWLKLTIHPLPHACKKHLQNEVLFSAYYLNSKCFYKMTEHSIFIEEDGMWRYLKGDVSEHEKLLYPTRNSQCPCTSGKKFKACCGRNV